MKAVLAFLLAITLAHVFAQDAFPDVCPCPDAFPCPSFCLECDTYDSSCMSGKSHARCNGHAWENCPTGYIKKPQVGAQWRCSGFGSWWTMYHCYRDCLGITTGKCTKCMDGYYGFNDDQTCNLCPAGSYCTDGVIQGSCNKGHYCDFGSTSADANECPPGTYGETTGLTSSLCTDKCEAGYWCGKYIL